MTSVRFIKKNSVSWYKFMIIWFRVKYISSFINSLLYYIFNIIILSPDRLMLQTSKISPFKYKINVIQRLKFYWIKYKSQRSAVSGQRSVVNGYTTDLYVDPCASVNPSPSQSAKS